ncbi:MAG: GIY-YIG nuclease family protein [Bacteroidales bacterium]|nr:GIY-YIG nuclease family protein [Bacteroidales bacterium]
MHFVYVLYSLKDYRLYKGSTSNIQKRLIRHNSGGSTSTAILLKRINFTFPKFSNFLFYKQVFFCFPRTTF